MRFATRADTPRNFAIRNLVRENRLDDPYEMFARFGDEFIATGHCWVWEDWRDVYGFAAADADAGWVEVLYVDPAVHGRGAGRALLEACCGALEAAGHRMAYLSTEPGSRAEVFYRMNGWREALRYSDGIIQFRKELI